MTVLCTRVDAFLDGELHGDEHADFRFHLASCEQCQSELAMLLQMRAVTSEAAQTSPRGEIAMRIEHPRRPRRRPWLAGALALAAVAATIVYVAVRRDPGAQALALLLQGPTRSIEARLCDPAADRWRVYGVARAATRRDMPLQVLAELEDRGDFERLGEGFVLAGDAEAALVEMARANPSPNLDSDRAAAELARGHAAAALTWADAALRKKPRHAQAMWNRALALDQLGLPLAAAAEFEEVAKLREKGWSAEAKTRAEALRAATKERHGAWLRAWRAGVAMVSSGQSPSAETIREFPDLVRLYLYDAVRAAHDRAEVESFRPLARHLDHLAGGQGVLGRYVDHVAAADFAQRRPFARVYAGIATGDHPLSGAELDHYLDALRRAGADDILLGALYLTDRAVAHPDEYRALARATGDPWFAATSAEVDGEVAVNSGDLLAARARLSAALEACISARLEFRCAKLEHALAEADAILHWPTEAGRIAAQGWQRSRRLREWKLEMRFLMLSTEIARFSDDWSLGRAYLDEAAQREPQNCQIARYVHESRAEMAHEELDAKTARRELAAVETCADGRYTIVGAFTLARVAASPTDKAELKKALAALHSATLRPGQRALVDYLDGIATGDRTLFRRAIAAASSLPRADADAAKARGHAYTALLADAARAGDFGGVVALAAEARGVAPAPTRCALALAIDGERTMVGGRGADGAPFGAFGTRTTTAIDAAHLVPPSAAAALLRCETVDVLALPPLEGVAGLLPPEIAWRYRAAGHSERAAAPAQPLRLVVSDVEPPTSLGLDRLRPWIGAATGGERLVHLAGPAATPERVLAALGQADEIEFHTHGLVDLAVSDASLLVLSRGSDGQFALTAGEIRRQRLERAPLVLLAACESAHTAPYLHQSWSLPAAFLEAGAGAVVAASSRVDDLDARAFFDEVRERIRAGASAATAVRDVRMRWLREQSGAETWIKDVVVFE